MNAWGPFHPGIEPTDAEKSAADYSYRFPSLFRSLCFFLFFSRKAGESEEREEEGKGKS